MLRWLRAAHQDGSLYFKGALASGAVATSLFGAMQWELYQRQKLQRELDGRLPPASFFESSKSEPESAEPLWAATVSRVMPRAHLDGPVMFRGVQLGDHVEVMKENVGSGGAYHELRNPKTGHRGLYPKSWVAAEA